jgi:methionyl-tRNA formyltransferase
MDSGLDTGDIIAQTLVEIRPQDTGDTLYRRLLDAEVRLFEESWPLLDSGNPPRRAQSPEEGTSHARNDLAAAAVQKLDLDTSKPVAEVIRTLRGLTTNDLGEAAYFEIDGHRYRVEVTITPE